MGQSHSAGDTPSGQTLEPPTINTYPIPFPVPEIEMFTLREIGTATHHFSYLVGTQGRLGPLYKGKLQRTGQLIAVRKLRDSVREFQSMMSNFQHPNIVELIGYCADEHERLVVFEFMVLGSLDSHLNGTRVDQNRVLEWSTRMRIAADVAKGLNFMHRQNAVYGGLKSTNVLLGEGFHAKLSDLWLAKFDDQASSSSSAAPISTRQLRMEQAKGYGAPEYLDTGIHTMKSDVYSYGILLLELLTGTKPAEMLGDNGENWLIKRADALWNDNLEGLRSIQAENMESKFPEGKFMRLIYIALMCVSDDPNLRPPICGVELSLDHMVNPDASEDRDMERESSEGIRTFALSELATATKNFRFPLGEHGRLGRLFEGKLRRNGQLIAVKRLNLWGPGTEWDFQREVKMLSDLQHPNIVKLIGYCSKDQEQLLVFEFMVLGSLDYHLNDTRDNQNRVLEWSTRMRIAADVARGLKYLHSQNAVYRGLKSTNVLLGEGFHAKLSDLWLAKFDNQASSSSSAAPISSSASASASTKIKRQHRMLEAKGYGAPEYLATGIHTMKSDVYSYGVLLLEIINGTRTCEVLQGNGTHVALDYACSVLKGKAVDLRVIQDVQRHTDFPEGGLRRAVQVVVMCHGKEPQDRPDMNLVVEIMNGLASNPDASEHRDSRSSVDQEGESSKDDKSVFDKGESSKDDKRVFEKGESSKGGLDEIVEESEDDD